MGRGLHRGTEERPELTEENRVEQDANPSAAAAAPPFDKGGRSLVAGQGGFYEILVHGPYWITRTH